MKSHLEVDISAPVQAVWDLVSDIPKWAEIIGRENLSQVQHLESGPPFGYRWASRLGAQTVTGESRFQKFEPPKTFVEESVTPAFRGTWTLFLEEKGPTSTRASFDLSVQAEAGIINWFLWMPRFWALRGQTRERLAVLKARAETGAGSAPGPVGQGRKV